MNYFTSEVAQQMAVIFELLQLLFPPIDDSRDKNLAIKASINNQLKKNFPTYMGGSPGDVSENPVCGICERRVGE